jgi:uncharacterized protein YgiM (DUF1202 family)
MKQSRERKMNKFKWKLVFTFLFILLAACNTPAQDQTSNNVSTQSTPLKTLQPPAVNKETQNTEEAINETLEAEEKIPTPQGTIQAVISTGYLNLRSGPGVAFTFLGSYPNETEIKVLERAPGNEWLRVELQDGKTGWMSAAYLTVQGDLKQIPLGTVTDAQVVTGKIIDSVGESIEGIQLALGQNYFAPEFQIATISDENGEFFIYLPPQAVGAANIQIIGINCQSKIVNSNCNLETHFIYNEFVETTLPSQYPILFLYEKATTKIEGIVTDANGKPVSIRVDARRTDGARSFTVSDSQGKFSLPVGQGTWQVKTILYEPVREGEPVIVNITPSKPSPETIILAPPLTQTEG